MILGDGLNGIAGTTLVEEFRMRMLDRLKDGRRCEGILRKLGIIVEQETYIAVLVSDKRSFIGLTIVGKCNKNDLIKKKTAAHNEWLRLFEKIPA